MYPVLIQMSITKNRSRNSKSYWNLYRASITTIIGADQKFDLLKLYSHAKVCEFLKNIRRDLTKIQEHLQLALFPKIDDVM